jgi:hypothetical protein
MTRKGYTNVSIPDDLAPLKVLERRERAFLAAFLDESRFDPEPLREGIPHRPDVARHPAAMWVLRTQKGGGR